MIIRWADLHMGVPVQCQIQQEIVDLDSCN